MDESPPDQPAVAAPSQVVEWRPGAAEGIVWNVLAVPLVLVGLLLYGWLATRPLPADGRAVLGPLQLLLVLAATLGLSVLLFLAHERVHGLVMAGFGARPRYGAMMLARVVPVLYTTAPGHLFTRGQYLLVALTPAVTISTVGAAACLTPVGLAFVVPLAIHLSGCVGDLAATVRLLGQPPGTLCEDLRDGIRFHRPGVST